MLECLNIFSLPFQAKLLWVLGFLGTEPKNGSGFLRTRTQKGFRIPGNENPKRVPKNGEHWLNSCFQRFGVGFPVLGNPFWVLVLRNPEPFLGSIPRNPEHFFGFSFPGTRNPFWVPFPGTREPIVTSLEIEGKKLFKHSNMLKNAQKRNPKCVPFLRNGTQRNGEP
jgi:hypothetical protein